MGKPSKQRERSRRYFAAKNKKVQDRRAARRAELAAQNTTTGHAASKNNNAGTGTGSTIENPEMTAVDNNAEMMEIDKPPMTASERVGASAAGRGRMDMTKKTETRCAMYFMRLLRNISSRQIMSARCGDFIDGGWTLQQIRDLAWCLCFKGNTWNDSVRLSKFIRIVFKLAIEIKAMNPTWFPREAGQVMLRSNLIKFLATMQTELLYWPVNAGGLKQQRMTPPDLVFDLINSIVTDRDDFLEDEEAMRVLRGGYLRQLTKTQESLFQVIADWKASFPGEYRLSKLWETSVDPSAAFTIPMHIRDAFPKGEDEDEAAKQAEEENEYWEGFEDDDEEDTAEQAGEENDEDEEDEQRTSILALRLREPSGQ